MFKTLLLPAIAGAVLATSVTSASAFGKRPDGQDRWEQQQILQEEYRRSREIGGSSDPITALVNLFSGTATERDIRPAVNHIQDVPGHAGFRLKSRWDH